VANETGEQVATKRSSRIYAKYQISDKFDAMQSKFVKKAMKITRYQRSQKGTSSMGWGQLAAMMRCGRGEKQYEETTLCPHWYGGRV
jgi:hypothetical protein